MRKALKPEGWVQVFREAIIINLIQDFEADFPQKVNLKIPDVESQPQNPEFTINPEIFHPCMLQI